MSPSSSVSRRRYQIQSTSSIAAPSQIPTSRGLAPFSSGSSLPSPPAEASLSSESEASTPAAEEHDGDFFRRKPHDAIRRTSTSLPPRLAWWHRVLGHPLQKRVAPAIRGTPEREVGGLHRSFGAELMGGGCPHGSAVSDLGIHDGKLVVKFQKSLGCELPRNQGAMIVEPHWSVDGTDESGDQTVSCVSNLGQLMA